MIQTIQNFFLNTLGREGCVFCCSMLPVIELRGAIPLGAGLGLPFLWCYLLAVLGNLAPVPLLLLFLRWLLDAMKRVRFLRPMALWLERKAEKNRGKVEKYAFWGLALFVAIPLPGTGAWTGALVAAMTGMRFRRSLLSILCGVLVAGVVMTVLSYGTVAVISAWF